MSTTTSADDRISDYERAICYYSIPRIASPVTLGLIVAYAVCLIEAAAALVYGLLADNLPWTKGGVIAFVSIVIFGILVFLTRGFFNELRARRTLAVAGRIPGTPGAVDDMPDPFADHVLIRRPVHVKGNRFACTDRAGNEVYQVEGLAHGAWWKVWDAANREILRVRIFNNARSFYLGLSPSRFEVYECTEQVAVGARRFSFKAPTVEIGAVHPGLHAHTIVQGGIYTNKTLVGRIYYLRHSFYLDIEETAFHKGILAYFVTMK